MRVRNAGGAARHVPYHRHHCLTFVVDMLVVAARNAGGAAPNLPYHRHQPAITA